MKKFWVWCLDSNNPMPIKIDFHHLEWILSPKIRITVFWPFAKWAASKLLMSFLESFVYKITSERLCAIGYNDDDTVIAQIVWNIFALYINMNVDYVPKQALLKAKTVEQWQWTQTHGTCIYKNSHHIGVTFFEIAESNY